MTQKEMEAIIKLLTSKTFAHVSKTYSSNVPFANVAYKKHQYQFNLKTNYSYAIACLNKMRL